jgi:CheY-like chemotaxis protein
VAGPVIGLSGGNRTILVVDDDPAALKIASLALREMGYRPVCSADPEEALRTVAANPPGIVIVDLLMPGVDGFEFVSRFRAMPAGRGVPIIVWTVKELDATSAAGSNRRSPLSCRRTRGDRRALVEELQRLLPLAGLGSDEEPAWRVNRILIVDDNPQNLKLARSSSPRRDTRSGPRLTPRTR